MWKNTVEVVRPQMTIWHIACYKYTYAGFVIFIALPLKQWLHEYASMLYCMYIACLFYFSTKMWWHCTRA